MPYAFDYALKMARQAVAFAESEGNFTHIRKWLNEIEAAYEDDMKSTVTVVSHMAEAMEQNAATRHPDLFTDEPSAKDVEWLNSDGSGVIFDIAAMGEAASRRSDEISANMNARAAVNAAYWKARQPKGTVKARKV